MFLTPRKFERNFVDAKLYVKKIEQNPIYK